MLNFRYWGSAKGATVGLGLAASALCEAMSGQVSLCLHRINPVLDALDAAAEASKYETDEEETLTA